MSPRAIWIVPSIFSDSRILSGLFAISFVPMPSSAMFLKSGFSLSFASSFLAYGSLPLISLTSPFSIFRITGELSLNVGAQSITMTPFVVPSTGATKTSPAGRFPNAPGEVRLPVSASAFLPFIPIARSVPLGAVISAFSAPSMPAARLFVLSFNAFQSTCIGP